MSSYSTGEVAKNYKMFANPVFITPGRFTYVTKIEQSYLYLATKITISTIVSIENQFKKYYHREPERCIR